MKIGFIISMYDEVESVSRTIQVLRKEDIAIIVIQSDPGNQEELLDKEKADYYELLPDIAGTKNQYQEERAHMDKGTTIPAQALTRNYSRGFTIAKKIEVDWWIGILGDVDITNLIGIKKIIQKMKEMNKLIGITRAIGQVWPDDNFEFTRIQKKDTTDFMPQFFIVNAQLVKDGLFNNIQITNRWASEQCFGDDVVRFCNQNSIKYDDLTYSICDYAYPKFIEGLRYNPIQARLPRFVDGVINAVRRLRIRFM
jgi:hypothetical protein